MKEITVTRYLSENGVEYETKERAIDADSMDRIHMFFGENDIYIGYDKTGISVYRLAEYVAKNREKIEGYFKVLDGVEAPKEEDKPKFTNVGCSQCGKCFGPGEKGFSHCHSHKGITQCREES